MSGRSRRLTSFIAGITTLAVALLSPLNGLAHDLFSAHMVQHLLLVLVAAPLLVYGWPAAATFVGRPLPRLGAWTTSAFVVGLVHGVVLWLWHLPGPYQTALQNHGLHAVEHLSLLGTALFFWALVIGGPQRRRLSRPAAAALVLVTALHSGALGAILSFASRAIYPVHYRRVVAAGLSPLQDQQLAGAIMWIPGGGIYLITIIVLVARTLSLMEGAASPKPGFEGAPR